jgi:3-isopropylmalate/(R)-2-methylmalate dehydratase small subunit
MSDSRRIDRVEGTAIPLRGSNIDTDRIIPARFLKAITFDGLGEHVFEDDRQACKDHSFSDPRYKRATILIVNENFGSGSSREHAPQALKRWGIEACIGESFSEIFRGNSLAIGLPCAMAAPDDIKNIMMHVERNPETNVRVLLSDLSLQLGSSAVPLQMSYAEREAFLHGHWDATGLLLDKPDQVHAIASQLPYISGF